MNGRAGAYNNIEDLKDWFFRQKMPYWHLWNSVAPISTLKAHFRKDSNLDIESLDESWGVLESTLRNTARFGGDFTIKVATSTRLNSSSFATISLQMNGSIPNSINGMVPGQIAGVMTISEFESRLEAYKQDRKIEDLESEIDDIRNGEDGIGRIMKWVENNPDLSTQLISKLSPGVMNFINGIFGGNKVAISGHGFNDQKVDENLDPHNPEDISEEQFYIIKGSLDRISKHFEDIPSFLKTLADFIDKNPDQAKMFFNGSET